MGPEQRGVSLVEAPAWLVIGVPLLALVLLFSVEIGGVDTSLFYAFNGLSRYTGPGVWAHITILGDGLVTAVLFLPWIRKYPERVWAGVIGALLMVLILRLFKGMWGLPRPLAVLPVETVEVIGPGHRRGSFPSGHTATFFLLLGIWALSNRNRVASVLLVIPGILVGVSRMAVGVHWPTDVLAGAALGWTSAWLGLRWAEQAPWGMRRTGQVILGILLLIGALVLLLIDHTGYPGVLLFQRGLAGLCLVFGGVEMVRILGTREEAGLSDSRSGN